MAGRYIINQTAGKRYIILEEDAEKIEGGYFDTEGVWHDLSGPLDGDLLGKYVINETDGKRIILLEEDADEIGGGYFDTDGEWHSFKSPVFKTITADNPGLGLYSIDTTKPNNDPPYTGGQTNNRLSYRGDTAQGLEIDASKHYKFTVTSELTNLYFAVDCFDETAAASLDAFQSVGNLHKTSTGWIDLEGGTEYTYIPPEIVYNSPPVRIMFSMKRGSGGNIPFSSVTDASPIIIEEVEP